MTPQERVRLRKALRHSRRQLSTRQQEDAASRLYNALTGKLFFQRARRIAFYLPNDGEIDPGLLLAAALQQGKHCYLPRIHPHGMNRLLFVRYRAGDLLETNRWGIYEPRLCSGGLVSTRALDLVFVPLVGFDAACNRLGMGKGFYDRSFSFLTKTGRQCPMLVGLAHECQKTEGLSTESWDIRMSRIVSDQHTYLHTR